MFNRIPSESVKLLISFAVSASIFLVGIGFIAGHEYAKHEIRASYCSVFGGDPRCK